MTCRMRAALAMSVAVASTTLASGELRPAAGKADNGFAVDLYHQLRVEPGNLFLSPFSISSALAMTWAGATGETAAQMATALKLTEPLDQVHDRYCHTMKDLNQVGAGGKAELEVANALFPEKTYVFRGEFLKLLGESYGAAATPMDFVNDTEGARTAINSWVYETTREKIDNLIPEGAVNPMTRMVLVNAIYFKGKWVEPFETNATREADFHVDASRTVKAPLMSGSGEFAYADLGDLQAVSLPYQGDRLGMVLLVPKAKDGLAGVEAQLTAETLSTWIAAMQVEDVVVWLPKFKMTWGATSLRGALQSLGIVSAFDAAAADFSGMTEANDLFLSDVLHKAFVDVNEEGTEAAAATGAIMALRAMPRPKPEIRADHPFLFLIVDHETGLVLFMGRLADPTA